MFSAAPAHRHRESAAQQAAANSAAFMQGATDVHTVGDVTTGVLCRASPAGVQYLRRYGHHHRLTNAIIRADCRRYPATSPVHTSTVAR